MVREISADAKLRGKIIPLAFHVDYWNHLGWSDPFSSPRWTERQSSYVRSMHLPSAYTPQMVVDGARQFVGTSAPALEAALAEESTKPPFGSAQVSIAKSGGSLDATVSATITAKKPVDVILVVYENGLSTRIAAGENAGSVATDDAVVRYLTRVATLPEGSTSKQLQIRIANTWNPARLGAAVLLQDHESLTIRGAATAHM